MWEVVGVVIGSEGSFDVDVISASCHENDEWRIFGTEIPVLEKRKALSIAIDGPLLAAVGSEPAAHSIILADFRQAMRRPTLSGFFCYRSIEGMMQSMKANPSEDNLSTWEKLRRNLRIERSAIDWVKSHADFPRHGKIHFMSDAVRANVFVTTHEIIRWYLEYRVRGKTALPEAEFPPLGIAS